MLYAFRKIYDRRYQRPGYFTTFALEMIAPSSKVVYHDFASVAIYAQTHIMLWSMRQSRGKGVVLTKCSFMAPCPKTQLYTFMAHGVQVVSHQGRRCQAPASPNPNCTNPLVLLLI